MQILLMHSRTAAQYSLCKYTIFGRKRT